jgi:hypothetical protein
VKQRDNIDGKSLDTMRNLNERAKKERLYNYPDMANTFRKETVRKLKAFVGKLLDIVR